MNELKQYLCIDLKSFYASVECVERGLDSMTTDLVVADKDRGSGTICLAVSPSLKEKGVRNRCRVFEIPKNMQYIMAKPRMKLYMEYSARIYSIYLKYVAKEDIHVYSVDECFLDLTPYLKLYNKDIKEIATMIINDVYNTTGIRATCGIGTNLFLAKIALDIVAKKSRDFIGYLDEEIFAKTVAFHKPITDIWNISTGISRRLAKYNCYCLDDVAHLDEDLIYKEFGVIGEYIIDHSHGREPTTMEDIHNYKSKGNSLSNSQILFEDYSYNDAYLIMKEMVDLQVLELVDRHLVCNNVSVVINYSKDTLPPTGGSLKLPYYTNSKSKLIEHFKKIYEATTNKEGLIRRVSIGFNNVIDEDYKSIDLFYDYEKENKEHELQKTLISIKKKYGKNAILKGMNFLPKATTRERNKFIGGHNEE